MPCKKRNMRQDQAAETKQKILEVSRKLFAENGYGVTSIRKINRAAEQSNGLVYHYFPNGKADILKLLIEECIGQILQDAMIPISGSDKLTIEEVLDQIFINFDTIATKHLDILKIVFQDREARETVNVDQLVSVFLRRKKWFPDILRQRAEAGEIRNMDFEAAADMLNALLMNYLIGKLIGIESCPLNQESKRKQLIDYQVKLWKMPSV